MENSCYLLAKFGRKEHLEALKNGKVFFNAVKNYRNDGTDYRGDSMEGKIPIDPATLVIYDEEGNNIFDYVPRPDSVTQSLLNDDDLLMFCASAITKEVMVEYSKGHWKLSEDYKAEIRKFGDYVLFFWSSEFIEKIKEAQEVHVPQFGYDAGIVQYRDLADFTDTSAYRTTGRYTDRYFVKDLSYKLQNEWRMIIDGGVGELKVNQYGGYFVDVSSFTNAVVMETDRFLETTELVDEEEK